MRVAFTEKAQAQFDAVLAYWDIRNQSTAYSDKLADRLENALRMILSNPYIDIKSEFGDTRSILMENYRLYYKIDGNVIHILSFWDTRQNPDSLLHTLQ
ncbi:MAG: type II toxin-antitoxin system RelE/ParE family toxin [Ignavibacteria bacterium]|jgi:toxin YoeB|nr:type II toxin-antitoxin system RelE/ParE family toxin [Ignavibacteria bacterium]